MKLSIIFLSLLFVSCKKEAIVERCIESQELSVCRCHPYKISEGFIGRVGDSVDHPLSYCDKRVSFSADEWTNDILELIRGLYLKERLKGRVSD